MRQLILTLISILGLIIDLKSQNYEVEQLTHDTIELDYNSESTCNFDIDSKSNIHLLYSKNYGKQLYYYKRDTNNLIDTTIIFTGNDSTRISEFVLKNDSNDILHIFYLVSTLVQDEQNNYEIKYQSYEIHYCKVQNGIVQESIIINSSEFLLHKLDFQSDNEEKIFLTYLQSQDAQEPDLGSQSLYFQLIDGNVINSPILVESNLNDITSRPNSINIELDSLFNPIIVAKFFNYIDIEFKLAFWNSQNNMDFDKEIIFSTQKNISQIYSTNDSNGRIVVVFKTDSLYVSYYENSTFTKPYPLNKLNEKYPDIALTSISTGISEIHLSASNKLVLSGVMNNFHHISNYNAQTNPSNIDNPFNNEIRKLVIDKNGNANGLVLSKDQNNRNQYFLVRSTQIVDPQPPVIFSWIELCEHEKDTTLKVIGENIKWLNDSSLNSIINTGDTINLENYDVGNYKYWITQTIGSIQSESAICNIEINETPDLYLGRDTTLVLDDTLLISPRVPNVTFNWSNYSTADSIMFIAEKYGTGNHKIFLTITNEYGCSNSDTLMINILNSTTINHIDQNIEFIIIPNPFTDHFRIKLPDSDESASIEIYNIHGKLINNYKIVNRDYHWIDTSELPSGTYIIRLKFGNGIQSKKIIKF